MTTLIPKLSSQEIIKFTRKIGEVALLTHKCNII